MRIVISNFEIIESLDLTLEPGINCIIGQSNNGKSSIAKALNALVLNKHSDNKIKVGKESYSIGIQTDDGQKVLCRRTKKGKSNGTTVYKVNDEVITKVGRTSLPQVEEALKMGVVDICNDKINLNYCKQFSYPFLLDKTPTQMYEFLSSSIENDSLFAIVGDMKSDLKDINDNVKRSEGKMDLIKDKYHKEKGVYDQMADCELYINAILGQAGKVNKCTTIEDIITTNNSIITDLEDSKVKLALVNRDLKAFEGLDDIDFESYEELRKLIIETVSTAKERKRLKANLIECKDLDNIDIKAMDKDIQDIAIISEYIKDAESFKTTLEAHKVSIDKITHLINSISLEPIKHELDSVLDKQDLVVDLKDLIRDIVIAKDALETTKKSLETTNIELQKIEAEISEIDVCPLCNTVLNK